MSYLFKRPLLQRIKRGTKTQTRRIIFSDDRPTFGNSGEIIAVHRINRERGTTRVKWRVGQEYAACPGRGLPGEATIRLLKLRKEAPAAISESDALAEGFNSAAEFLTAWGEINPNHNPHSPVWVCTFELSGERTAIRQTDIHYSPTNHISFWIPGPDTVKPLTLDWATTRAEMMIRAGGLPFYERPLDLKDLSYRIVDDLRVNGLIHEDKKGNGWFSTRALLYFHSQGVPGIPVEEWRIPAAFVYDILKG